MAEWVLELLCARDRADWIIENIATDPAYRGRELALQLIDHVVKMFAKRSAKLVQITTCVRKRSGAAVQPQRNWGLNEPGGDKNGFVFQRSITDWEAGTARLALLSTIATVLLLIILHVLSPEFSPSWRVISEYALGQYGWVLSLMFVSWGISSWALAVAIWSLVQTTGGKVGLCFLIAAGIGEFLASVFDVRHMIGHGIAGLLGVVGFPVAALLLSISLRRNQTWRRESTALLWIANISWISVVLLIATLAIMTIQLARVYGGHLPQHAPKSLPAGVLALDGYADRLIVLSNCAWIFLAAVRALRLRSKRL